MDATRRVVTGFEVVLAAGLGAVVAVPLSVVVAAAFYLSAAVQGIRCLVTAVCGTAIEETT